MKTTPLRLLLMAAIAGVLWFCHWPWAPVWLLAYAVIQAAIAGISLGSPRDLRRRQGLYLGLTSLNFAVAGIPTWFVWTQGGELGLAAAIMYLCGMLLQLIVSSLRTRRLFWWSASPLIAYLLLLPPIAWGPAHLLEGLTVSGCSLCLLTYLIALWLEHHKALRRVECERATAVAAAQAKGRFLATMSHEVRTPMNAVLGAANLLRGTRLDEPQSEYVEMISSAGAVLMHVLDDVLDLSKIEAGKFEIIPAWTDLPSLLRQCGNLWRPQAEAAGLTFALEVDPATPSQILVDGGRLSQILFNLLSNAIKFTASGQVGLTVAVQAAGPDRVGLTFTVSDTGQGIEPEAMARLFGAFEQADPSISRRFGGTGLGLAISQRLAGLMGGEIAASSQLGQGSCFILRLTAEARDEAPAPAADAAAEGVRAGLKVLVAEDNPVNRKIVSALLSPLEPAITFAENGAEAVEALEAEAFDLVLMDIQMPVMDGVEATRRLRALDNANARIPVIALTANVMEDQRAAYREAGMDAEVAKPVDPRTLLETIGALVD